MKMNKFFIGMAAVALLGFTACSSDDEPTIGGNGTVPEGMDAYLNVALLNAPQTPASKSRADWDNGDPTDSEFEYGNADENAVSAAVFYFFDSNKNYLGLKTTINKPNFSDGTEDNVEKKGANTIVLQGLSGNEYPNYMMTVLNAPSDWEPATGQSIDQVRKSLTAIFNENSFVMSTSSYLQEGEYAVNALKTTDFNLVPAGQTPPAVGEGTAKYVSVYVERLAAKVQVSFAKPENLVGNVDGCPVFKIKVNIAGNLNDEDYQPSLPGNDDEGTTEVFVKFNNWDLNATTKISYMSKNIDEFTANDPWTDWSAANRYRSYWGKAAKVYNEAYDAANYNYIKYSDAKNLWLDESNTAVADYCPENTNTTSILFTDVEGTKLLNENAVTSVIFAAQLFEDKECKTPLNGLVFNGVFFKEADFVKLVLSQLDTEFFIITNTESNTTSSETVNGVETTVTTTKDYRGLEASEYAIGFTGKNVDGTGNVLPVSNLGTKVTIDGKEYQLYKKVGNGTEEGSAKLVEVTSDDIKNFNTDLKAWNGSENASVANAYTAGKMFYSVPIEHNQSGKTDVAKEALGKYGVVRNHWYVVNVNTVLTLGQGVFIPSDGTEEEEEIKVDPKKPSYWLGATINILSWKVVQNSVDL